MGPVWAVGALGPIARQMFSDSHHWAQAKYGRLGLVGVLSLRSSSPQFPTSRLAQLFKTSCCPEQIHREGVWKCASHMCNPIMLCGS
jgi:hypothetical protein